MQSNGNSGRQSIFDDPQLYEKYKNLIWSVVCKCLFNKMQREDAMQDIFLKLYKNEPMATFTDERARKAWVLTIANNTINDICRKEKTRKKHIIGSMDDENVSTTYPDIQQDKSYEPIREYETLQEIRDLMSKLKPEYYEVIRLYYYEGYSVKQIAEIMDIPENTVYSRLKRARTLLKKGKLND